MTKAKMSICLWFDDQAEEAANFYTSIFKDAKIGAISRFGKEGFEHHGKAEGTAMTVDFSIMHMDFIALNGGPLFRFNEAVSIVIYCDTQTEIDHYWTKLCKAGEEGHCGWLKDKYGLSWQITPSLLPSYLTDTDAVRRSRVEKLVFQMMKLDIGKLKDAFDGK